MGDDGLQLLINNAGMAKPSATIDEVTLEVTRNIFEVNTFAPVFLTKTLLPLLKKSADKNSSKPMGVDR